MLSILRRKTNKTLVQTFGTQIFEIGLSFIRNILLIRYIGLEIFGKYQYLVALLAFIDFGYASFDSIIRRFFVEEQIDQQKNIVWSNLIIKIVSYCLIGGAVFIYGYLSKEFLSEHYELLAILLIYFFFNNILNTITAVAQGLEMYSVINLTNMVLNTFIFLIFLSVYLLRLFPTSEFLFFYIGLNGLMALGKLSFFSYSIHREKPNLFKVPKVLFFDLFRDGVWNYRAYFSPLIMGNLCGYVINFVPSLILGSKQEFENISYLEIIKKIFRFIHKLVPTTVRTMLATIVARKKESDFPQKWRSYALSYISFSIIAGLGMFFFSVPIMSIYKVEYVSTLKYLFALYAFYLSLGAWSQSTEFLVLSSLSTYALFWNSLLRQIYVVAGYILVGVNATPVTLSIVTVSSVMVSVFQMSYWVWRKERALASIQMSILGLIIFQSILVLIMVYFDLYLKIRIDFSWLRG